LDTRTRVSAAQAALAGAVAWLALNALVYTAAPLLSVSLGTVAPFFGALLLPTADAGAQSRVGRAVLLAAAVVWGLMYARVEPRLPGRGFLRGLLFGALVWLGTALVLPVLGALHPVETAAQPGFLGFAWQGTRGVVLSILAHLGFGAALAALLHVQTRRL